MNCTDENSLGRVLCTTDPTICAPPSLAFVRGHAVGTKRTCIKQVPTVCPLSPYSCNISIGVCKNVIEIVGTCFMHVRKPNDSQKTQGFHRIEGRIEGTGFLIPCWPYIASRIKSP